MTGVSYAGGIELTTAAQDKRIDAIAPIIAWHSLLTSLYKEETVKSGWSSALYALGVPIFQGPPGPAHHLRVRQRRHDGHAERRGPRLVRLPRPRRPRQADHGPDVHRPGHGGHAVHAARGDRQLRDRQGQRRAAQDDVVLRRPRRLPDRAAAPRVTSRPPSWRGSSATWPRTPRSTPARASSGSPTTPSGARAPTIRCRRARRCRDRGGHARAEPRRRALRHGRHRRPRGQRRQRGRSAAHRRRAARRRAAGQAHLQRHRRRTRPRTSSPRSSTRHAAS